MNNYEKIASKIIIKDIDDKKINFQIEKIEKIYNNIFFLIRNLYVINPKFIKSKKIVDVINEEIITIENKIEHDFPEKINLKYILDYYENIIKVIEKERYKYKILPLFLRLSFEDNITKYYCYNNYVLRAFLNTNMRQIINIDTKLNALVGITNFIDYDEYIKNVIKLMDSSIFNTTLLLKTFKNNKINICHENLPLMLNNIQTNTLIQSSKEHKYFSYIFVNNNVVKCIIEDYINNKDIVDINKSKINEIQCKLCVI